MSVWDMPGVESALRREKSAGASGGQIAKRLTAAFKVTFTRNMVVGKLQRLGLNAAAQPYTWAEKEARRVEGSFRARLSAKRSERERQRQLAAEAKEAARIEREALRSIARKIKADPFADVWTSKPLVQRNMASECAWPIGDGARSCCAPIKRGSYCASHGALAYNDTSTAAALAKSLRRFV